MKTERRDLTLGSLETSVSADPTLAYWEDLVAAAWTKALRRKSVDRDTDFRTLGMNSNQIMQVIADLWLATSRELPVNAFFEVRTIRRMAASIRDGSAFIALDLVLLRSGEESIPLFLFPGGPGNLAELVDLVHALEYPGAVYGIAFSGLDGVEPFYDRIEAEAARALSIIRETQPSGPVRLVGYSVGGITALETARLLREHGETAFVSMIDTSQNDHLWPYTVWVAVLLRKYIHQSRKQLRLLTTPKVFNAIAKGKPPTGPRRRGTQFTYRFRNPHDPDYPYYSPYWSSAHPPNYTRVGANVCRMKGFYKPSLYDGEVFFLVSAGGDKLTCSPKQVWPKYLPRAEWISVPGNHLSIMVGRHAARLAREISERLRRFEGA
ncbi:MAG TPA: thioesterase domain-containing protein [Caulobacteraceae bacterium]|jgi:thioesterase domain-containing protein|nr:thioesterase domain-containing protein [Caulobacteraceae bacterium]